MFWYLSVFSVGTHRGNLLVNRGSIFLRPQYPTVWALCGKTGHAQSINAQACLRSSAVIMSTLNLQIDLLWASSRQHECGIKENKLSESILLSVMLGWVTIHLYVRVYLCRIYIDIYLYTRICVYEFMRKQTLFSGLTVSRRPQTGGICLYWLGHLFRVTSGVFTADSVCARLLRRLLLGSIFLNTFP